MNLSAMHHRMGHIEESMIRLTEDAQQLSKLFKLRFWCQTKGSTHKPFACGTCPHMNDCNYSDKGKGESCLTWKQGSKP